MKKIVIIGPESTGKSTLCEQLARHYQTLWVPEFAREYLQTNGKDYTFENLLTIAKGQMALEEKYIDLLESSSRLGREKTGNQSAPFPIHPPSAKADSILFIDTDMYVVKVWCEFVFDKCHNWILNQIALRKYDLYLLCNIDLPWVKDSLREYPDLATRAKLYYYYKDIVLNQATPWIDISGNYKQRLNRAIQGIDSNIS
ncbi:MAG: ATP-binding protein [Ginsengibacter sp.]